MAFFCKFNQKDLLYVGIMFWDKEVETIKEIGLDNAILTVDGNDDEFAQRYLNSVIEDRKRKMKLCKQ